LQGWGYLAFSSPSAPNPVFLCADFHAFAFNNSPSQDLQTTGNRRRICLRETAVLSYTPIPMRQKLQNQYKTNIMWAGIKVEMRGLSMANTQRPIAKKVTINETMAISRSLLTRKPKSQIGFPAETEGHTKQRKKANPKRKSKY